MNKILIIDDDLLNTQIYAFKLKEIQQEAELCSDPLCALEKIKNKYQLILLDVMMPQMDGLEVLKQIKKGVNKDTPVIIHTNLLSEKTKNECLENGAAEYLLKADHTPNQLIDKIKGYLGLT